MLWLSSIQAFSDDETQQSRWLDPQERNPHYSFVECMCSYFDDTFMGDEDALQRRVGRGHLTEEEAVAVEQFHALADAYESPGGDDYDDDAILADPKWHAVVDAAEQAKQRLLPLLKEPAEREALMQPLHWDEEGRGWRTDLTGSIITPARRWMLQQLLSRLRRKFG
jgi:hypothetical protein